MIIAPFGSPVVPLVKTISARSSGRTAAAGSGSARRARSGRDLDPDDGQAEGPAPAAVCRLARTRLAPVRWPTLASEVLGVTHVERDGRRRQGGRARKAMPHSGRLTAQMMTRSPCVTPASARTWRHGPPRRPGLRRSRCGSGSPGGSGAPGDPRSARPRTQAAPRGSLAHRVRCLCRSSGDRACRQLMKDGRCMVAPGLKWLNTMVSTSSSARRCMLWRAALASVLKILLANVTRPRSTCRTSPVNRIRSRAP